MGLRNNAELMHYAMQHQLVELTPRRVACALNTIQKHCSLHELVPAPCTLRNRKTGFEVDYR